ncbi:hypothetical protein T484DRAFT_1922497, partial [Baffinella frigidus]
MCGTNDASVSVPGNIVLDQDEIGTANGGGGPCQLNINVYPNEASDWLLHSLLIWDSGLSTATMKQVTAALREVLDSGGDLLSSVVCTDGLACVCGVGTYYDPSQPSRCSCLEGYAGTGSNCTACGAGTYKDWQGPGDCLPCEPGSFKNVTGAGACSVCLAASTSNAGAAECDACLPNHGVFPLCICPSGTYLNATSDTCVTCPGGLTSSSGSLSVADCVNVQMNAVLQEHPASAIYSAAAFDAGTLQDLSGHGRDATVTAGTVSRRTASGHGTSADVVALAGDTSAKVLWPVGSIPATFTVCSVTRYDDLGGSRLRILNCQSSPSQPLNWLHGHYGGMRGLAYYPGFKTNQVNVGTATDWLVMCGTSDAGVPAPGNIVLDQDEIGIANGGAGPCQLAINYDQPSDWLVHSLLIWDSGLSTATMKQVTAALREALDSGEDLVYSDVCTDGLACVCGVGTYYDPSEPSRCHNCPGASTSAAGATSVAACDCLPNHGSFPFCICSSGTYLNATSGPCVSCPGGLSSSSGSLSVADCVVEMQMNSNAVLQEHPASAIYSAAAFDAGTLQDLSGHGRDATVTAGTVSLRTASGHGASAAVVALAGSNSDEVLWPVGSIPATFTVCSVTRYDDLGTPNVGTATDWLVMCGTSDAGVAVPGNIVLDQDEIGIANGGAGPCQLNINYWQPSDWLVHSVLIWDSGLSTATMKQVTAALREALDSGGDLLSSTVCTDGLACVCGVGTYYD